MDIDARMQRLEELVREAKSMPLSSSALINRQEMLELLEEARNDLPEEIKQARWIVKDRQDLLNKARKEAEAIVESGHAERDRTVSEQEVVQAARQEADRTIAEAREQSRLIRLEAEDYVDAKLAQFEIVLEKTRSDLEKAMDQVRRGRDKLRGITPAQQEFAEEEPLEEEP